MWLRDGQRRVAPEDTKYKKAMYTKYQVTHGGIHNGKQLQRSTETGSKWTMEEQ
jgi:hypothetical protein